MAEFWKPQVTGNMQSPGHSFEPTKVHFPKGWKYKSLKLGPITVPWFASPESQLILVSFVCFLCPGKVVENNIYHQDAYYVKACSMLSSDLVVQDSLVQTPMLVAPQARRSTQRFLLSVSSPALLPTPSVFEPPSQLVALDTVYTSLRFYATTTPKIPDSSSSLACYLDAAQVFYGRPRARL